MCGETTSVRARTANINGSPPHPGWHHRCNSCRRLYDTGAISRLA
ncbi:hypothetical protein AZE42_13220 [Rhizopogon vesiculosus]|uniref:Uncharacterized protein n=1 Tax=Rhizopogon vesiculosus TaxID=180088 RepID=A0A1J8PS86_9AGAM|nr:hypothetical protein AZE42_13220 [Rhizopogon vesiculosus]